MIPILIRSKDRPFYLNTTLTSLTASNIDGGLIVIADDCSSTKDMNDYLFTNKEIKLPKISWYDEIDTQITTAGAIVKDSLNLSNKEIWDKYIGNIPIKNVVHGIKDKFTIIQPETQRGDKGGLLWTIFAGFTLFRNAEKIIILEDDLIFHKDWLNVSLRIYNQEHMSKLGAISVYNRENEDRNLFGSNLYFENPEIGGVMYLIPRKIFDMMKRDGLFDIRFDSSELAGDVFFQKWIASKYYKIFNSSTSYIQHIGIQSICRPGRFLRYSKKFLQPYAWNNKF